MWKIRIRHLMLAMRPTRTCRHIGVRIKRLVLVALIRREEKRNNTEEWDIHRKRERCSSVKRGPFRRINKMGQRSKQILYASPEKEK